MVLYLHFNNRKLKNQETLAQNYLKISINCDQLTCCKVFCSCVDFFWCYHYIMCYISLNTWCHGVHYNNIAFQWNCPHAVVWSSWAMGCLRAQMNKYVYRSAIVWKRKFPEVFLLQHSGKLIALVSLLHAFQNFF